jgi:hypothetical protein
MQRAHGRWFQRRWRLDLLLTCSPTGCGHALEWSAHPDIGVPPSGDVPAEPGLRQRPTAARSVNAASGRLSR